MAQQQIFRALINFGSLTPSKSPFFTDTLSLPDAPTRLTSSLETTPVELLLKIFADIDLPSLVALTQSSPRLRCIIKTNAATICNVMTNKLVHQLKGESIFILTTVSPAALHSQSKPSR